MNMINYLSDRIGGYTKEWIPIGKKINFEIESKGYVLISELMEVECDLHYFTKENLVYLVLNYLVSGGYLKLCFEHPVFEEKKALSIAMKGVRKIARGFPVSENENKVMKETSVLYRKV